MVDIHITGVHYEVSDRVKGYITDKFLHLRKFSPGLGKVHVTVHHAEKHGYRVDVDMHLPHGKDVVAHDREETVFAAIDVASDKCAAQLRRIHDREVEAMRKAV